MGRKRNAPTVQAIIRAHAELIETLPNVINPKDCWACGFDGGVERAHIIGVANGGGDDPSNFLLLCGPCHKDQPDGASFEAQVLWMRRREPYIADLTRRVRDTVELLRDAASEFGWDEAILSQWANSGVDLREVMRKGSEKACGSVRNARATALTSLVDAFKTWYDAGGCIK